MANKYNTIPDHNSEFIALEKPQQMSINALLKLLTWFLLAQNQFWKVEVEHNKKGRFEGKGAKVQNWFF